jgi:predicted amidohydrolase YtcJ
MKTLFFIIFALPSLLPAQIQVYHNARIFTSDVSHPYADAIAINGKKIIAVGREADVKQIAGPNANIVDCGGRFMMAGIVDSHIHAYWGGKELGKANIDDKEVPVSELVAYAKRELNRKDAFTGDVLVINSVNLSAWSHISELRQAFNQNEFANVPVVLSGMDKHTAWSNNVMLKRAGIDKKFIKALKPEDKIYYGVTAEGESNGFTSEKALDLIQNVIPKELNIQKTGQDMLRHLNSLGITAFLDPGASISDSNSPEPLEAYKWLSENNKLTAHIATLMVSTTATDFQSQHATLKKFQATYTVNNVNIIGFKFFADGVLEYPTRTAAVSIPYTGTTSRGALMIDPDRFTAFATAADKEKLLVHVHAIGDRAVTEALHAFEAMRKSNGDSGIPHTITHLQLVQPADFEKFGRLNILASMQLFWAFGDFTTFDIVKPYIDPSLYKWMYPTRSLLQNGGTICGASDWPVTTANPFPAITRAETRLGPKGVLDSTQRMPRIDMLYAYTINAAKAMMADAQIGSLTVGKSADMILLDRDVLTVSPEEVSETKVVWVVFEGAMVFDALKR